MARARNHGYTGRLPGRRRRSIGLAWVRDVVDDLAKSSPARLALITFTFVNVVFIALLTLPISTRSGHSPRFSYAVFDAISAVCVTGLSPVELVDYWSTFGQVVIIVGVQVGGLGILTLASIMGLAVSRRLGLKQRLVAAQETKALRLGEVGTLLRGVIVTSLLSEVVLAAFLTPRFMVRGEDAGQAVWHGVFYSISAFNNAGFNIHEGGLATFGGDPWILIPLMLGVFVGALGFPVILTVALHWRTPSRWDLHAKMTLTTSVILVVLGTILIGGFELNNPKTLGSMSGGQDVLDTVFAAVMPRSGGFATIDVGSMHQSTHLVLDMLMFIGGGSASTAGGIKVTTLAVLFLAAYAEARGNEHVEAFGRRIPPGSLRLAVAVTLAGATIVASASMAIVAMSSLSLDDVLLDVISAFATCGLSSGVTTQLDAPGQYVLAAVMFVGRTGTITLAAALALRERRRLYTYPEERPIVG
ncbi:TrkH family potassium uptake protein [Spelaeicoccus albus]|uniref:Trk-type K+ transport system membrane component n=1 Tax=Spelaeicoccus albus TaxID=1280376 RepID=A0A7Z0IJG9_9MICO|nr:potassium transporter TrkG [Spelaeicoccus albus]NYI69397.1 Trk-type K+ transport system membrane component [Spelaeicoccus albus]